MILAEKTNQVQFTGNFETIKVGIDEKNVAHFFRMIANLYQDPVMAVLREIGANCIDAIKEAKTESLGWELHLPTRLDGNVRFVDNGVGISPEQMVRIYSIIGASSKRNNNDLIGGFGVGKWSICSLVNNFHAISRYNGVKSTYFISLQSNGLPDIKVVSNAPTNERNGFEVKFLCPAKHVESFNSKVEVAYRFFDIKPNVFVGNEKKTITYIRSEPKFLSCDKTFAIYDSGTIGNPCVVMGGVGYRLPVENLLENKTFDQFSQLLRSDLVIYAPIGEYSITPSREAIQLDDLTISRIKTKLNLVIQNVLPELQKQIDAFSGNLWDAKLFLSKVRNSFSFLPDTTSLNWKGAKLTCAPLSLKTLSVNVYHADRWHKKIKNSKETSLVVSQNAYIFLNDLKMGGIGRCKHFIDNEKKTKVNSSIVVYLVEQKDFAKFVAESGWIGNMNLTSALPIPPKTSVKAGGSKTSFFSMLSGRSYGINDAVMPYDGSTKGDGFILFPTHANKIGESSSATIALDFCNFITATTGKTYQPLFLAKKQYEDYNENEVNGKPITKITDFIAIQSVVNAITKESAAVRYEDFRRALPHYSMQYTLSSSQNFLKDFKTSNHFICELYRLIPDETKETNKAFRRVVEIFAPQLLKDSKNSLADRVKQFQSGFEKIKSEYPLFYPSLGDVSNKQLMEYVEMVDASKVAANKNE